MVKLGPLYLALLALSGCSGSCGADSTATSPGGPEALPASSVGDRGLVGRVTYAGEPNPIAPGPGGAEPCSAAAPTVARSVGAEGGLADVVVLVSAAPGSAATGSLEVSAQDCRMRPTVAAVQVGTRMVADNRDERVHTFHLRRLAAEGGRRNLQNLAVPPGNPPALWEFSEPGIVHISSDDLPQMESWVFVYQQGQSVVTDSEGRFELPELPQGQWQVTFWHPRFGRTVLPVMVPEDGPASLYASLPPSL